MNWITIGSIALNIVAALSYFKVPEMLQQSFVKRMEHQYQLKLDMINRNHEILPELFYHVAAAISYYEINYKGITLLENDFIKYAELKNFTTQNQFFIPHDIKQLATEIDKELYDFIMFKHRATTNSDNGEELIYTEKQFKSRKKLVEYEEQLEQKIYEVVNTNYQNKK